MAGSNNFVPDTKASVRLYRRHQRHSRPDRLRYSAQEERFLKLEATRLSTTASAIYNFLYANTAFKISQVTNTSHLLPDVTPFTGT